MMAVTMMSASGCGRPADHAGVPRTLHVDVRSDTAAGFTLHLPPPRARVSLERVSPAPPAPSGAPAPGRPSATPGGSGAPESSLTAAAPLPEAAPDTLAPAASTPVGGRLTLEPPVLREGATLVVPARLPRAAVVELDVRVDRFGHVDEVRWAAGSTDAELLRAAERCAESMTFDPARLGGVPVDAWCRQRFEFGKR